jgi:hypothetical protein
VLVSSAVDRVCQLTCDRLVVFSSNKTDRHNITELLLKHHEPKKSLITNAFFSTNYDLLVRRTRDEHANNYTTDRMVVEIYRPMQSVFITARFVSSVPVPEEVCSSQHSKI